MWAVLIFVLPSLVLRENDIDGVFDMTFSVEHDKFGRITHHDLKPNRQDIPVTDENKSEYAPLLGVVM